MNSYVLCVGDRRTSYDWYDDAVFAFLEQYPDGTVGQDGGIAFGGPVDLCWATAKDSTGPDAADRAIGRIYKVKP